MKPSLTNVFVPRGEETAIYNTRSGRVVVLPTPIANLLDLGRVGLILSSQLLGEEDYAQLMAAGILVPDDRDELQVAIHRFQRGRFAAREARVVVLPTRECNLRCFYCYQQPRISGSMSGAVAERTVRFIEWLIRDQRAHAVSVGFYGGEPLLNVDACVQIMEPLSELAAANGVFIEFPVTSNGFLLTRVRSQTFFDLASAFHLTIEGERAVHDRIRCTPSGHGSYDLIMEGIAMLVQRGLRVTVRIHQNELSGESFTRILDDLGAAGLHPGATATIYCTSFAAHNQCSDAEQCRHHLAQTRIEALASQQQLVDRGQAHRLAPLLSWSDTRPTAPLPGQPTGCLFAGQASCAVDFNGDLYKCPDDLRPEACIGTMAQDGTPRWNQQYFRILGSRWWQDSACTRCEYLPVCGAGCALCQPPASTAECAELRTWYHQAITSYVDHYLRITNSSADKVGQSDRPGRLATVNKEERRASITLQHPARG